MKTFTLRQKLLETRRHSFLLLVTLEAGCGRTLRLRHPQMKSQSTWMHSVKLMPHR